LRQILDHKIASTAAFTAAVHGGASLPSHAHDAVAINVIDPPGSGGASHVYDVVLPNGKCTRVEFQNGPVTEAGINGLTQEVLLAIVIDRLRSFQSGPFACEANGNALGFVEEALHCLHDRTRERMGRGVEGKHAA